MIRQKVRPDNGNREGGWVAFSIALLLLSAYVLLPFHQSKPPVAELESFQISVKDLHQDNLTLIADLKLAHEEIHDLYSETNNWPDIKELESFWLPPFSKDQSWERLGAHHWEYIADGYYLGVKTKEAGANTMLLDSRYSEPAVWIYRSNMESLTRTDQTSLIDKGWKLVVFNPQESASSIGHQQNHVH